jgi:hypothetical protein
MCNIVGGDQLPFAIVTPLDGGHRGVTDIHRAKLYAGDNFG